uniref:uncharacterized protein LOC120348337 isoform X1 n=1 Tax=Styela clava TaxID=7725 RepID=UPI00193A4D10|nr:uncharacterized protein LOC120348337 isoform X1 [Styela clava]
MHAIISLKTVGRVTMIFSSFVSILIVCLLFNPADGKPGYRRENENCALPVFDEVNYNMLPDSWYHILNTKDPVEQHIPCYAVKYFKDTSDGTFAEFQVLSSLEKSLNGVIPFHWYHNGTSITRYDTSFEFLRLNEAKYNGAGSHALKEIQYLYEHSMSCFTDYEHYFMCLQCGGEGQRYIWVHSRNPHPTAEDILRVHNKLVTIGGGWSAVFLFLSECRKFSMPETIAY